ncbi:DNA sulfur modification protein DndE [Alteromonas sp. W364]|uniref:DNA sulfur modification protein DndE n=1 Tax=Alteromonas sp. W364 TaxID=3075610 RepID=UPI0028863C7E|nr:DNA sulfur modification protein DndE [Alteromonas sp. W364]MDT0628073.1 DNA sulfur modification protein DndE [Alteromonas sp. W364]
MLPNRMQLNKSVEEQLKKLKSQTGITPNVAARIAFFKSIESNFKFQHDKNYLLNGTLVLDKFTWLGRTQVITELLLKQKYPDLDNRGLHAAWASHVENGSSNIRNHTSLYSIIKKETGCDT